MACQTQISQAPAEEREENRNHRYAIMYLGKEIRSNPHKPQLYHERSISHYELGDYQASLDDANTAIRLGANHHENYYQKGLALCGLKRVEEALVTFKKSIESMARDESSKLSDIFKLLTNAGKEMKLAVSARREMRDANRNPATTPSPPVNDYHGSNEQRVRTGADPVDSTTDRQISQSSISDQLRHTNNQNAIEGVSSNLVVTNCNNNTGNIKDTVNQISNSSQNYNGAIRANGVTSSANHMIINRDGNIQMIQIKNAHPAEASGSLNVNQMHDNQSRLHLQQQAQYDWNIRRSERIFLHHSSESPTTSQVYSISGPSPKSVGTQGHRQRAGSNPSSISSGRGPVKRSHESDPQVIQQANKLARTKETESDIDVDDSYVIDAHPQQVVSVPNAAPVEPNRPDAIQKRVVIAPSSSMPATGQRSYTIAGGKDDSYSSKYKRARRDRERARRGTSKLCTIKPSDLEDLQKPSMSDSGKRAMRVIAPIDGWLYSGQLTIDDNPNSGALQYVVKLDGDTTGINYLFNQDTVLNDVIKEVKVKSVSDLRKGARICCYWSRQYKCLSTGVVTSRTFEATKSLVSVKYDNGDLSALPLEDLRLLPPDYPKYMSNCDPLLLARNGDGAHTTVTMSGPSHAQRNPSSQALIENEDSSRDDTQQIVDLNGSSIGEHLKGANKDGEAMTVGASKSDGESDPIRCEFIAEEDDDDSGSDMNRLEIVDETIPQTDEIIDFITNEDDEKVSNEGKRDLNDRAVITKDMAKTEEIRPTLEGSGTTSEENSYPIEYRPWVFDGPPKRSRRHGRTYRDNYSVIRRGNEVLRVGDSAELMPRDESILPFIAKIDGFWATVRGEMRVKVRWYYRLIETEDEPYQLADGDNALFETDHFDENDVQSIFRATKILSWDEYRRNHLGTQNNDDNGPKIFYLAGYYDPVRRLKYLRTDVKESL